MAGHRKTGLVALFHKFYISFECFFFGFWNPISWKMCFWGDIHTSKIVQGESWRLTKPSQRPELGGLALRGLGQPLNGLGQLLRGLRGRGTDSWCILQDFVSSGSFQNRCPKRDIFLSISCLRSPLQSSVLPFLVSFFFPNLSIFLLLHLFVFVVCIVLSSLHCR